VQPHSSQWLTRSAGAVVLEAKGLGDGRDGRGWKIVHHHSDLSPAMIDVLGRLPANG